MLRLRESQIAEGICQRQRLLESFEQLQIERKNERTQLEGVIEELQSKLYVLQIFSQVVQTIWKWKWWSFIMD